MPVRGKTAGNRGQGSKWITKSRRRRIYERDGYQCVWCSVPVVCEPGAGARTATLDHLLCRDAGGTNDTHNLVTACMRCNRERGSLPVADFAARLYRETDERPASILARVIGAMLRPLS